MNTNDILTSQTDAVAAASNPDTAAADLAALLLRWCSFPEVLGALAKNPATPNDLLLLLARNRNPYISGPASIRLWPSRHTEPDADSASCVMMPVALVA